MRKYYIWYAGKKVEVSASLVYEYRDVLDIVTLLSDIKKNEEYFTYKVMDSNVITKLVEKYHKLSKILRTKIGEEVE